MTISKTKARLLDEGEALIRNKGYSAFSYADLAQRVGIRKASIHHHFPTKGDLGTALVDGYTDRFRDILEGIEREHAETTARLRAYGTIYETGVRNGMLCLCGVLAAEVTVLPEDLQARVRGFFDSQIRWLIRVIADGKKNRTLRADVQPERAAIHVLSGCQGAAFVAWAMGKPELVNEAMDDLVRGLVRGPVRELTA